MGGSLMKSQQGPQQEFARVFGSSSLVDCSTNQDTQTQGKHNPISTMVLQDYIVEPVRDDLVRDLRQSMSHGFHIVESDRCLVYETINESQQKQHCRRWYFRDRLEKSKYLSNIFQLKELTGLTLYSQLNQGTQDELQFVETSLVTEGTPLNLQSLAFKDKVAVLRFCCSLLLQIGNGIVNPEHILQDQAEYQLTQVEVLSSSPYSDKLKDHNFELLVLWLFSVSPLSWKQVLETEMSALPLCLVKQINVPPILNEIIQRHLAQKIDMAYTLKLLDGILHHASWLDYKMNSFHACLHYQSKTIKQTSREWLFLKSGNRVYFYHMVDRHSHCCTLLRKRRKVDLDACSVVFDEEECELIFQHSEQKNRQHLVCANEFELELHESISDITLHQKLPVALQKASLYLYGRRLYILDKNLYQLQLTKPRVIKQLTKQVCRSVHLLLSSDSGELYVLQQSRDIFKQGIHLWSKEGEIVLALAGNDQYVDQMSQIQVNLESVVFCTQVFNGVFLIMSGNNMYVLDFNFKCFFSYASLSQIQSYSDNRLLSPNAYRYMFEMLDVPFEITLATQQQSNQAALKGGMLHILGFRGKQALALNFSFDPLLGAIRLEGYRSLMYQCPLASKPAKLVPAVSLTDATHKFLVDQDELFMYKYEAWRYSSERFLLLKDVEIVPCRNSYEFHMRTEPVLLSLRDQMAQLAKRNRYYSPREARLLAHRITLIFLDVLASQTTHRNINNRSLFFTSAKVLKLISWVEPPRVEFVSDYKDFMLLIFSVLTGSQLEKLTTQAVQAASEKYEGLEDIYKMTLKSIKMPIAKEMKADLEVNLNKIRESLEKDFTKDLGGQSADQFVFNFVPNTNQLYLCSLSNHGGLIKVEVTQEDNPFLFGRDDQLLWNQQFGVLYVMANLRFYSLKLESEVKKEKRQFKAAIEDEECLPISLRSSSLCLIPKHNCICSFGGVEVNGDGCTLSRAVFSFNFMKLSWEEKPQLCYTLCQSTPVVSEDNRTVYLFGGVSSEIDLRSTELKLFTYDIDTGACRLTVSCNHLSPYENSWNPPAVMLLGDTNSHQPVFAFYNIRGKTHQVRVMELTAGGIDISFSIDEAEEQEAGQVDQEETALAVSPEEETIARGSYLAKDKLVYHIDSSNRLEVVSFKNIAQPFLEIVQSSKQ